MSAYGRNDPWRDPARETDPASDTDLANCECGGTDAGVSARTPIAAPRGRGTATNPANRVERLHVVLDSMAPTTDCDAPRPAVATQYLRDASRSVISRNDSPDVTFSASLNPYRGCEHGCVYCYARPTHEYLGFSAGLDFETRILAKNEAPRLLEQELQRSSWKPQTLGLSGVTDPYQPIESALRLTRACLKVLLAHRNPVIVITKNELVTRDIDLLARLAEHGAAAVAISVTTLDESIAGLMEPRASRPRRRLAAIRKLARAGIPVTVLVGPVVPGLTDYELPEILEASHAAGARSGGYIMLRLPGAVSGLFDAWLARNFPDRRNRVLRRIRSLRDGQLNDSRFKTRMRGEGPFAEQTAALYRLTCRRLGLSAGGAALSTAAFRRNPEQPGLF